jgi:hypothetical protein
MLEFDHTLTLRHLQMADKMMYPTTGKNYLFLAVQRYNELIKM